ncbi:MEDS domain-containing protein [uncultured Cellulomonas sp.]|uniref:MEDS domain-containing protein n=1 Tax=uncultured Cellulomonas sp. TaxID=189682 RepID=UPI002614E63F|nr:MEDS domain-containing protein [uncultured Cellulomonas sp.]
MTAIAHADGAFRHDLVLHDGPAELVDLMVPFVREGAAAGDHVILLGEPDFVDAIASAVPEALLDMIAERPDERFPARDLHRAQQTLGRLDGSAAGARIVNQMPAMTDQQWLGWRRYEAAANVALARFRAWGKCAHDVAALDPRRLAELRALHPFVQSGADSVPNADFDGVGARVDRFFDVPRHPALDTVPTLSMLAPAAGAARGAVRDLAVRAGLSPTAQESVILATSETVTNGWVHGRPPVVLRAWAGPGRLTVAVSDGGAGPDPLAGMVAQTAQAVSGRGLWLVHLLIPEVHHRRGEDGYTITFSVDSGTAVTAG